MIYEMRSYRAMPGRLPDLIKRFDTVTLKLFDKHGIKQAGFWTTEVGESNHNLMYLIAYESMADREKKWGAFGADEEWQKLKATPGYTDAEIDVMIAAGVTVATSD